MADRDDTDELPPVDQPPPPRAADPFDAPTQSMGGGVAPSGDASATEPLAPPRDGDRDHATVVPPTRDGSAPDARVQARDEDTGESRPAKFAVARRQALLWDAGYCMVAGVVLLVLWAADRPVESLPDWSSLVTGLAVVLWAAILVAIASGGVGRTATSLVGLINLAVGVVGVGLGWLYPEVNTLALVVAAQVAAIGVVQLLASVRR